MTTLNFFVYDYPGKGNDSPFIEDEIKLLIGIFSKIKIIPLKKKEYKSDYVNSNNIEYDFSLNHEIYNLKNIHIKLIKILFCSIFWKEIFSIKRKNIIKKILMVIKERFIAECIFIWSTKQNNKNISQELYYYSFWSNHTLLAFYLLKKKKKIKKCFARTLGSDLNGFIPNDTFVPFKKYKFKYLDFILILNEGQRSKLTNEKLIDKDKILKCYQGIKIQNFCTTNNKEYNLHIVSCGSLIHVKNTLKILNFIYLLKTKLKKHKIIYTSIGDGYQKNDVKKFVEKKLNDVEVNIIDRIPNFFDFLEKNRVDFFINLSLSEGMSFALMEALSCSIPVVCSNIPGNMEVINENNGYIIDLNEEDKSFDKIIDQIKFDLENKDYIEKKIQARQTVIDKIDRYKSLNLLKKIIQEKYFI